MEKKCKFDPVKWEQVNEENKELMQEFLDSKKSLSDKSLEQYENAIQIFLLWVYDKAKNKHITELKKRDFLKYQNYLIDQELSSSAIKLKRSAVSSLNNYIENYYEDEYPNFRNFVKGVDNVVASKVHKKEPLTPEEMDILREELTKRELWEQLAYLEISYFTGARREEIRQLKKEIAEYKPNDKGIYITHEVRCKGRGKVGKVRRLKYNNQALNAIKKWLEIRGEDDCEYLFISKYKGEVNQLNPTALNYWCREIFGVTNSYK